MNFFQNIINYLNEVYKTDKYTEVLSAAIAAVFENIAVIFNKFKANFFFDTLNEDGANWWENLLSIKTDTTKNLSTRGAQIQARWQTKNERTKLDTLQNIVEQFFPQNGKITFSDDKFLLNLGVKNLSNTTALIENLEEVKPAHIMLDAQAIDENTANLYTGAYCVVEREIELLPEMGMELIWNDFYGNHSQSVWADEDNNTDNDGYWSF